MKHKLSILLITVVAFTSYNCFNGPDDPIEEVKKVSEKCEPKWWEKNLVKENKIYGNGFGLAVMDKAVAKDLSYQNAILDINSQLRSRVISNLDKNYESVFTGIDNKIVNDFVSGIRQNVRSKTDDECQGCIRIKFVDCVENNYVAAYSLVELDFEGWKKNIEKGIYDEEMEKASDQIKAQRDKFYESMGLD